MQAGADIAAERHDLEVRPNPQDLRGAADRGGAELGALGQVIKALHLDRHEGVAHVLAFEKGHQRDAVGQAGGHVLARMDADIDATGQHGLIDFLGEQTLAAYLDQAGIAGLRTVAAGRDHLDGDLVLANPMRLGQQAPHQSRLGQGQRAAACSDPGEGCRRLQSVFVL